MEPRRRATPLGQSCRHAGRACDRSRRHRRTIFGHQPVAEGVQFVIDAFGRGPLIVNVGASFAAMSNPNGARAKINTAGAP
jgi:hypothetical protein